MLMPRQFNLIKSNLIKLSPVKFSMVIFNLVKFNPTKKQILAIKAAFFLVALIPLIRLFVLGFQENLTANPIEFVERSLGTWAIIILLVTLSLTPLRQLTNITWPIQLRRMAGLFMFFYACLHFATYIWLDKTFDWAEITKDIIKHPWVLVGFSSLILTIPLAMTSNNFMIRRLKQNWKKLHQLVYLIAILGLLHFWWLVKKDYREPLLYTVILVVLLSIRLYFIYKRYASKKLTTTLKPSIAESAASPRPEF